MHTMYFADEVRSFDEIPKGESAKITTAETGLAVRLIEELSNDDFEPQKYEDEYAQRVMDLVNKKAEGQEITLTQPQTQRGQVIDLMAALKGSLGKAKEKKPAVSAKPAEPEKGPKASLLVQEMKLFSTAEVANIVNLPNSRIRSFVRAGFLAPAKNNAGTLQFSFRDLLFLKTAKSLLASRVPPKRIVTILSSLKRQLPDEQHLSSLKIYADGRRVVVWDGKAQWQPDSGQFLFNFDARSVMRTLKLPQPKPAKANLNPAILVRSRRRV